MDGPGASFRRIGRRYGMLYRFRADLRSAVYFAVPVGAVVVVVGAAATVIVTWLDDWYWPSLAVSRRM